MTKVLYLVRHGQTDWNIQRKMQGHVNIPLNDLGKEQARSLQGFFSNNPVDPIFSSDLDRAFETIQIATATMQHAPPIKKMTAFREVHLGEIEGLTETEIKTKYGIEAWHSWISLEKGVNFAYPGGETHQESLTRSLQNIETIFKNYEFKKAALCTHGLLIRRLGHHLSPDLKEVLPIPNCGVFELRWQNNLISFHGLIFNPQAD